MKTNKENIPEAYAPAWMGIKSQDKTMYHFWRLWHILGWFSFNSSLF